MAKTGKPSEPPKPADKTADKTKTPTPRPADNDDEDGDFATPKQDRYGNDDEPL